jgi:hypothetical protein
MFEYNLQDECSFVSLRDVKRAMIVFKYLYDMMDVFGPLMDQWAKGERRHVGNEDDDQVRDGIRTVVNPLHEQGV